MKSRRFPLKQNAKCMRLALAIHQLKIYMFCIFDPSKNSTMKSPLLLLTSMIFCCTILSCKKKETEEVTPDPITPEQSCSPNYSFMGSAAAGPKLIFKFHFDSTQARLNNIGQSTTLPSGHGGQSPRFNSISQHYIELAGDFDFLGAGEVLYVGSETNAGGSNAIDYCESTITEEDETFFSIPISAMNPGTYKWLRVSLAYQNYDIYYKSDLLPGSHVGSGSIASFVGFNTYLTNYDLAGANRTPSTDAGGPGNHAQGYWAFVTNVFGTDYLLDGQAPAGATTVPNPFTLSPIPAGSCVVTGQFVNNSGTNEPLVISGTETEDIVIIVSLSTNKSFEWIEVNPDGFFQPEIGEAVVDMGLRGLVPIKN